MTSLHTLLNRLGDKLPSYPGTGSVGIRGLVILGVVLVTGVLAFAIIARDPVQSVAFIPSSQSQSEFHSIKTQQPVAQEGDITLYQPSHPAVTRSALNLLSDSDNLSLTFRDVPVGELLLVLARQNNANLVMPEPLTQPVSLSLSEVSSREAFAVIVKASQLQVDVHRQTLIVTNRPAVRKTTPAVSMPGEFHASYTEVPPARKEQP